MRWFRRVHAKQLIRAQAIILKRIKLAKTAEANCMTAAIIQHSPVGVHTMDGCWMSKAREWRLRRMEYRFRFLQIQKRVDRLLRDCE